MPDKRTLILYPFILAIYPIFFYYNLNKHEVWISETLAPTAISLLGTLLLLFLFKLIFKNQTKAGILTFIVLILFFAYEAILNALTDTKLGELILLYDPNLFWSYGVSLTVAITGLWLWKNPSRQTEYLNITALILLAFPITSLISHTISVDNNKLFLSSPSNNSAIPDNFNYVGTKPDIYYIILDGYMRNDVMKEFWGFDNSEFIKSLESRGFYIAPKSRSNYQTTWFSLASSLNMEYLPDNLSIDTTQSINNIPFIEAIAQNKVAKLLKSIGYQYIHLPPFHPNRALTKNNNQTDIIITNKEYISPFSRHILNKTFLKNFKLLSLNEIQTKRREILYGFKKLEDIPHNEEPTFTYAHFLMPHAPHAFNSKGELPAKNISESDKYFEEILFANKKINHLVDYLQQNSQIPPIIIIQGDHGYFAGSTYRPDAEMIKKGYSNLNAYYLPDMKNEKLYEKITPVNSFRLIFDSFFQTKFGMLKDKSYFITNFTSVRKLIPVPSEDSFNKSGLEAWVDTLEETILNRPDFERAHTMLGVYYKELQLFPEAKVALKKAIHLNPNLAWPYILLAEVYYFEGKYPRALQKIKHAIDIDEQMPTALALRGKIEMSTGKYHEAISSFKQAMKTDPINLDAYISLLSRTYALLKNKEKTLLYAKKAIKISPTFANYNNLGTAYALFGLNKEAKLNWIKSLKISPRNPVAYHNLGKIFLKTKDYEEAIKFYQKTIAQKPDYLHAFFSLGIIYATLNKNIQAVEYYKKTLALDPNHMLAHFQLGNVLLMSNQSESALLEYKKAIKLNPDHTPSFVNLGHTLIKLGRVDKARKTYEDILLRQPNISVVHKNLGFIYYEIKENPGKAIYHFQEYLRLSPNQSDTSQIKSMIQTLNTPN
jgi:tetratricopeptide (TPR) repeat protein